MMSDSADKSYQQLLSMLLFDMSYPLGAIQICAELLENYLAQIAEQGQIATVIIADTEIPPQEALDIARALLKNVEKLEMLKHKTRDDIRSLLD